MTGCIMCRLEVRSMKKATFERGVHPHAHKGISKDKPIEKLKAPAVVIIPLSQHVGPPCEATVSVGDRVLVGQKIADNSAPICAPIHASVSGTVKDIGMYNSLGGAKAKAIVIENDFQEERYPELVPHASLSEVSSEEIIDIAREAGLVGMGGATFPTAAKIRSGLGKVEFCIINAAECEPYLTADYRLMMEQSGDVIEGLLALMKAFSLDVGYIGVEDNKPDAIALLTEAAAKADKKIEVVSLHTKYPQGGEKQLIFAITGREVPSGKLPAEVGAAVFNLGTCISLAQAIKTGMPCVERVVTVTGHAVNEPKNLLIKVGTTFEYILNEGCAGITEATTKVISGGPMMGVAQHTLDVPVTKGTSGILVLTKDQDKTVKTPTCIRCGKCIGACPMGLLPCYMYLYGNKQNLEGAEEYNTMDCIECGACTYVCPGRLHLVQTFRVTKLRITEARRAAANK